MKTKLKNLLKELSERSTINNQYEVLTSSQNGIVSQTEYFNKQIASVQNIGYKIIRKGQFTYRSMSDTGLFFINRLTAPEIGIVSPAYPVFEIISDDLLPEYLELFFRSTNFQHQICTESTGSTRLALKYNKLCDLEINVPSLCFQSEIVNNINVITNVIDLEKKQLKLYDELVKSRFIEMFDKDIQNTKMNILDDYCEFVTVGIANSAVHAFCNDGVIMFRNQNIRENYLDTNDVIRITEDFASKYKSKALKENDILAVRTGYPGVSCVVPKEYEGCQTFTTLIARLNDTSAVNPHYLCYFINSKYGKEYVKGNSVGAAQQNFGATAFAKMPVYIPPIDRQLEFVEFSKQIDKSKFISYSRYFLWEFLTLFSSTIAYSSVVSILA